MKKLGILVIFLLCNALLFTACGSALQADTQNSSSGQNGIAEQPLRVFSINENIKIKVAIQQLKINHPGLEVEYEFIDINSMDSLSFDDFIITLNTELITGNGPDVLMLDWLPAESYVAQGLMVDLDTLVDTSNMYDTFSVPLYDDSGRYVIPMAAKFPLLFGSELTAGSLEDIITELQQYSPSDLAHLRDVSPQQIRIEDWEPVPFFSIGYYHIWEASWYAWGSLALDGYSLQMPYIEQALYEMQLLSELMHIPPDDVYDMYYWGRTQSNTNARIVLPDIAASVLLGHSRQGIMLAESIDHVMLLTAPYAFTDFTVLEQLEAVPLCYMGQSGWFPYIQMGITQSCTQQELAAELLQIMLSNDLQKRIGVQSLQEDGVPVTKTGSHAEITSLGRELSKGAVKVDTEACISAYEAIVAQLGQPNLIERVIMKEIQNIMEQYLQQEITLPEACAAIEKDLDLLLKEKY